MRSTSSTSDVSVEPVAENTIQVDLYLHGIINDKMLPQNDGITK